MLNDKKFLRKLHSAHLLSKVGSALVRKQTATGKQWPFLLVISDKQI